MMRITRAVSATPTRIVYENYVARITFQFQHHLFMKELKRTPQTFFFSCIVLETPICIYMFTQKDLSMDREAL